MTKFGVFALFNLSLWFYHERIIHEDNKQVEVSILFCIAHCTCFWDQTRDRMKVSSAPTPIAITTASTFMKGKKVSRSTKV